MNDIHTHPRTYVSSWQIPAQLAPLARSLTAQGLHHSALIPATKTLYNRIADSQPLQKQYQPIDRRISSVASARFIRH